MKRSFLTLISLCAMLFISAQASAQDQSEQQFPSVRQLFKQTFGSDKKAKNNEASAGDVVTLTVNGQGATKDEATASALRSAIEQAFGVFVSSNTEILNDEIVRDEIATLSSGNIQTYEEISCINMPNGEVSVTLSATVALSKLVTYAQNHGSAAEFAGQTFAMNVKMMELNKKNERTALENLYAQLKEISKQMFNFEISVGKPVLSGDHYNLSVTVSAQSTEASDAFINTLLGTAQSLSLSETEIAKYQEIHYPMYYVLIEGLPSNQILGCWFRGEHKDIFKAIAQLANAARWSYAIKANGGSNKIYTRKPETVYWADVPPHLRSSGATHIILSGGYLSGFRLEVKENWWSKKGDTERQVYAQKVDTPFTHTIQISEEEMMSLTGFEVIPYPVSPFEAKFNYRDPSDDRWRSSNYVKFGNYIVIRSSDGYDSGVYDWDGRIVEEFVIPNVPNEITVIPSHTFFECITLKKLTIPETVQTIEDKAFYNCPYLKEIYCKAPIPPKTTPDILSFKSKIYVPRESLEAYKSAPGWEYFAQRNMIEGYDF